MAEMSQRYMFVQGGAAGCGPPEHPWLAAVPAAPWADYRYFLRAAPVGERPAGASFRQPKLCYGL
jgi:hypothetical protein